MTKFAFYKFLEEFNLLANMIMNEFKIEELKKIFQNKKTSQLNSTVLRESAVLIIIYPFDTKTFSLILTKRNSKLKKHSGEISFPGGRFDAETDKDKIQTALRESFEEIGSNPEDIEVIGVMEDIFTLTGYGITPVVALAKKKIKFEQSVDEVQKIMVIPIEFFLDPNVFSETTVNYGDEKAPIYNFNYTDSEGQNHSIWGATAHIIMDFLKSVYNYNPSKMNLKRPGKEKIEAILEGAKK